MTSVSSVLHTLRASGVLASSVFLTGWMASMAQANPYVGSTACRGCHSSKYRQVTNSIHAKMIRVDAHLPGVIHGDLTKTNAPTTSDVHWVIGGWYKEESYIRTNWTGSNMAYTVTQFEWNPIARTYANNKSLRDWLVKCAGCHTTGYDPTNRAFNELNIGCEKCHGPGGDHVDSGGDTNLIVIDRSSEGCGHCHIRAESAALGDFPAKTFNFPVGYVLGQTNTLKYVPEALTVTASFFPDGTSRRHRQQFLDVNYPGVRVSKHYEKGISCVQCHDPHTAGTVTLYPAGLPTNVYGIMIHENVGGATNYVAWDGGRLWHPTNKTSIAKEDLCKVCHDLSEHHVHQFNTAASNAVITCVDCHMPDVINVNSATLHGALHPHTFLCMLPATSMKYGANNQPNSCVYRCHQETGTNAATRALWADALATLRVHLGAVAPGGVVSGVVVGLPDRPYAIETCSDLMGSNWMAVTTNMSVPLTNDLPRWGFEFTDSAGANVSSRFYRIRAIDPVP